MDRSTTDLRETRRRIGMVSGAIALCAVVALGWIGAAHSQSMGANDPAVRRWEYRIVFADANRYGDTEAFRRLVRESPDALSAVYRYQERLLGELGRQGWELSHVVAKLPSKTVFYLKRPLDR